MEFLNKIGEMAKNATVKASDTLEINRINGDIFTEKQNIEILKQQIGEYYWAKFATGEKLDPEAMVICDKIVTYHDKIRALNEEILTIKRQREEGLEEDDIIIPDGRKFCTKCGKVLQEDDKFCPVCGTETNY